jgi:phosphoribosylformylglycinamidine synthase subunit PurQ / glutaminase
MTALRVAVLQYPGTNCEYETMQAARAAGLEAGLFRWNRDPSGLSEYAAFILPGGFSYQDRIRAGAVAARKPLMRTLAERAAAGTPILGICNGAQVLVEAGLVPGVEGSRVQMALAANYVAGRSGYYCTWTTVKVMVPTGDSPFLGDFAEGETFPIPIAHGEGRFVTQNEPLLEELAERGQQALCYSTADGKLTSEFPVNPNGSTANLAGLTNVSGHVLAMMPHPERCAFFFQLPETYRHPLCAGRQAAWGDRQRLCEPGPGLRFFTSLRKYLERS